VRRPTADPFTYDTVLSRARLSAEAIDGGARLSQYARMKRTTISLPDNLAAALEREAARQRVSVSQIAREAIEARLGMDEAGPRPLPFAALGASGLPGIAGREKEFVRDHWPHEIERDSHAGDR
jgi:plasmid stability protein